jgi:hypothetical protein
VVGGERLDQWRRLDGLGVRRERLDDALQVGRGGIHRAGDGESVPVRLRPSRAARRCP